MDETDKGWHIDLSIKIGKIHKAITLGIELMTSILNIAQLCLYKYYTIDHPYISLISANINFSFSIANTLNCSRVGLRVRYRFLSPGQLPSPK